MREILFRGKRIDNGEWIAGQLIRYNDWRARIVETGENIFCYEMDISIIQTVARHVDPETVGQYTGLCDKNGKKIFEGDIIKAYVLDHELEDEYLSYTPIKVTFSSGYFYPFHLEGCWRSGVSDIEVIGNIHDNPELLEG